MPDLIQLKKLLDKKVETFNRPEFIANDPVSVPHQFSGLQDIEISGFFAAILAWGIRKTTISKCNQLMGWMDNAPYDFCINHTPKDLKQLQYFVHRTFNGDDLLYFISFFQRHYREYHSLEDAFFNHETLKQSYIMEASLDYFYNYFFSLPHIPDRTRKHIAAPKKQSACKRLNMYLRWMVRNDDCGVDFGIWKSVGMSELVCPLDVHVARVARSLGLLTRKQNDWRAAMELTANLKRLDADDPVKYDYALFGMGIIEKF